MTARETCLLTREAASSIGSDLSISHTSSFRSAHLRGRIAVKKQLAVCGMTRGKEGEKATGGRNLSSSLNRIFAWVGWTLRNHGVKDIV
ncbi:hypothetical protein FRC18_006393 [Serendipita sp. 400]|nr:hypothetical protein FRC18_006393 [Serendipita sp. 400]